MAPISVERLAHGPLVCVQEINSAELLRLYLDYDLLEEAANLTLELIDSVCGGGKEFYGLKVGTTTTVT